MFDLPDAPWIRDAEINGMPEPEEFECPVCGATNPDSFYVDGATIIGCSECVACKDAYEWYLDHKEISDE